ncbi:hypothetical protein F4861DRAFT_519339 [Xylaria intraflava]|nr:hypothetical protein F4861DRAFT_519339 [Xylaria intraflava]
MPLQKVPVTFVFRRSGVRPPVFVAGSFSDPPWKLHEMDAGVDQHGDYVFTKKIMVNACSNIQYKFRHGSGDWWTLDSDAPTVTDEHGTVNSLLCSPARDVTQPISPMQINQTTGLQDEDDNAADLSSPQGAAEKDESRYQFFAPIEEGSNTPAEMTDSSFPFDSDDFGIDDDDDIFPMFSHECFAYTPEMQGFSDEALRPQRDNIQHPPERVSPLDIDYDDPRLEYFPSDRDSIIAAMRRLSDTVEADRTVVDTGPLSSIFAGSPSDLGSISRKTSSSNEDDASTSHRKSSDIGRHPAGSARNSLGSIAEGDEVPNEDEALGEKEPRDSAGSSNAPIQYVGPNHRFNITVESCGSNDGDDDEGIAMSIGSRGRIQGHSMRTADDEPQPTHRE